MNSKLVRENSESERMVQLLQTQRDIYSRNVQEYSSKALQADQLSEENSRLREEISAVKESEISLRTEVTNCKAEHSRAGAEVTPSKLV